MLDIDNDGSFTIENKEIDRLIIGMNLIDEMKFDAHTFRQDLNACGGVVDEVIVIIKKMVNGADETDERATSCQIEVTDPEEWFNKKKGVGSTKTKVVKKKTRNQGEF